jgi:hypothetical protein
MTRNEHPQICLHTHSAALPALLCTLPINLLQLKENKVPLAAQDHMYTTNKHTLYILVNCITHWDMVFKMMSEPWITFQLVRKSMYFYLCNE